jgi:hypothetical protein
LSNFVGQNASAPDSTCNPSVEPGTLTVPCRARGMPPDHKFDVSTHIIAQSLEIIGTKSSTMSVSKDGTFRGSSEHKARR